jgi:hypothetical protein
LVGSSKEHVVGYSKELVGDEAIVAIVEEWSDEEEWFPEDVLKCPSKGDSAAQSLMSSSGIAVFLSTCCMSDGTPLANVIRNGIEESVVVPKYGKEGTSGEPVEVLRVDD